MAEETGDRYRDMRDVFERVISDDDFPTGEVERLELVCHASGDVTWRVWTPRAEEPIGGYLEPAE